MKILSAPPLLSRILLVVSSIVVVGVVFVFVSRALEPVPIRFAPETRPATSFNPKADVSKHPVFPQLKTTDMANVPDLPMGRQDPFQPIDQKQAAIESAASGTLPGTNIQIIIPSPESSPSTSSINTRPAVVPVSASVSLPINNNTSSAARL